MTHSDEAPYFPYMVFARTRAFRSTYSLTQSGMPNADASLLGGTIPIDLGAPGPGAVMELQAAIARHLEVDVERVFVTLGASGAMHLAAAALFRPGVRVASEIPSYEPVRALPRYFGAESRLIERRAEDGWALDPADAERALQGPKVGHVFTTNPNNPTGAKSSAEEIAALARVAERARGVLLCCEVYMEYCRERRERVHAFRVAPNTISMGSLTKAYGVGPLRVGWLVLGEGLARERAHFEDVLYLDYVDPSSTAARIGVRAFEALSELARPIEVMQRTQKPVLAQWLASTPEVDGRAPELGLTAFPKILGVTDTHALHRHLAAEHQVDVVPGEFFGRAGHLRLGCGLAPERLAQALERVALGIRSFRAR